jgi:hypothetical protein
MRIAGFGQRRDPDAAAVHVAETTAFADSFLAATPGFAALAEDTHAIMDSLWWSIHFGTRRCFVEPLEKGMPNQSHCSVFGQFIIQIRYQPNEHRYAVTHELAHAANAIMHRRPDDHGPQFRAWYIELVEAAFGDDWAHRLAESFADAQLTIGTLPEKRWDA